MTDAPNPWTDSPEEVEATAKAGNTNNEIVHFKAQEGQNSVRVVGAYKFYHEHWFAKVQRTAVCPGEKECPVCSHSDKEKFLKHARTLREQKQEKEAKELFRKVFNAYNPRPTYAINVIDRADGKVKIWKFSRTIKKQIEEIAKKYGDPSNYDLVITKTGKGKETRYTVFPDRENRPLTEEEKKLKVFALATIFKASSLDRINALLRGELPQRRQTPATATPSAGVQAATTTEEDAPNPTMQQADLGKLNLTDLSEIDDSLGLD